MSSQSEFDINVLHEVACRPILWNSRNDNYKESDRKPSVWMEMAEKLQSTPVLCHMFTGKRYKRLRTFIECIEFMMELHVGCAISI